MNDEMEAMRAAAWQNAYDEARYLKELSGPRANATAPPVVHVSHHESTDGGLFATLLAVCQLGSKREQT